MYRRTLLAGAFALGACDLTKGGSVAQYAKDIRFVADGLGKLLNTFSSLGMFSIPVNVLNTVSDAFAAVTMLANSIEQASSTADAKPMVQRVIDYIGAVLTALSSLPFVPPQVMPFVLALRTILPVIAIAVGILLPPGAAAPTGMTADQARAILRK